MNIIDTGIPGFLIIEPKVHEDSRGYFMEVYNQQAFRELGIVFQRQYLSFGI